MENEQQKSEPLINRSITSIHCKCPINPTRVRWGLWSAYVCTDSGCSCSGCVQTDLGYETFNYGLSRAYLHGVNTSRDGTR